MLNLTARHWISTTRIQLNHTVSKPWATCSCATMSQGLYSLSAKDANGQEFQFDQLKGKVVLVVNVASKCGFTGQYAALQKLYTTHKDKGFVILGFPCNQFGGQEPGTEEQIVGFCQLNYGVDFPIMEKCEVNGDNTHPVYRFLKSQKKSLLMERIKWNFEKFLIDKNGNVVERFTSVSDPMGSIEPQVSKLLGA